MRRKSLTALVYVPLLLAAPSTIIGLLSGLLAVILTRSKIPFSLVILLVFGLASINSTKQLSGDLETYHQYSEVLASLTFLEALAFSVEPGFYLLNWIVVGAFGLGFEAWVFVFTCVYYLFMVFGLLEYQKQNRLLASGFFGIVSICLFSPIVFEQTAHLARQYFAGAIAIYGLVKFVKHGRMNIYLFLAPLCHATAAVFISYALLVKLLPNKPILTMISAVSIPPIMIRILLEIAEFLNLLGLPKLLAYGISRITQSEYHQLNQLGLGALLFTTFFLILSFLYFSMRVKMPILNTKAQVQSEKGHTHALAGITAFICFFVLLLNILELYELAIRLCQYIFMLAPFLLMAVIKNSVSSQKVIGFIGVVTAIGFCLYDYVWVYDDFFLVLIRPWWMSALNLDLW